MTTETAPRDVSLEQLEEGRARRLAEREEDAETGLDELIDELVERASPGGVRMATGRRETEFVCIRCHLILSRSCRANGRHRVCRDCVAATHRTKHARSG